MVLESETPYRREMKVWEGELIRWNQLLNHIKQKNKRQYVKKLHVFILVVHYKVNVLATEIDWVASVTSDNHIVPEEPGIICGSYRTQWTKMEKTNASKIDVSSCGCPMSHWQLNLFHELFNALLKLQTCNFLTYLGLFFYVMYFNNWGHLISSLLFHFCVGSPILESFLERDSIVYSFKGGVLHWYLFYYCPSIYSLLETTSKCPLESLDL